MFRHLQDLRARTYEGAGPRPERVALFRRAVELLDPVVRSVLDETNRTFLQSTGAAHHHPVEEKPSGDAEARWELSWPAQREAQNVRGGKSVGPIQVVAWFAAAFTHPHLSGSEAGNWPLQVTSENDAQRQDPIVRAIVEAELHQRIFRGETLKGIRSFSIRTTASA